MHNLIKFKVYLKHKIEQPWTEACPDFFWEAPVQFGVRRVSHQNLMNFGSFMVG